MSLIIARMLRRSAGGDMQIDERTEGRLLVGPHTQPDAPSACWIVKIERKRPGSDPGRLLLGARLEAAIPLQRFRVTGKPNAHDVAPRRRVGRLSATSVDPPRSPVVTS